MGTFNNTVQGFRSKDLALCCEDHLFHVLPTDAKATSADTCNDLIFWVVFGASGKAQFAEMLNARHLIARCTIVFSDLRLYDDLRIEFAGNDEIRRLVETFDSTKPAPLGMTRNSDSRHENTAST